MSRKPTKVWQGALCLLLLCSAVTAAEQKSTGVKLLREGTMLSGVDGTISRDDSKDLWRFKVDRDVNEPGLQIPAGTQFVLLPSTTLEYLITDANDRQTPRYRLSAHATQYQATNFLFPSYFLPLSKLKDANEPPAQAPTPQPSDVNVPAISEPGRTGMAIPPEIAQALRNRRSARPPQRPVVDASAAGTAPRRPASRVLVDVVGFIKPWQGRAVFIPDAFGRNVSEFCYQLLPNQLLQQAEQQVAAWPEPTRLMVAGLVTEYRGRRYLLLQRVIRVYSHGNFGG
jgi:hypothetical protein